MKCIEITATSVDKAVEEACKQLGLTKDEVDFELVKEGGFIIKKFTVKVTQKQTADVLALNFIQGVIDKMGIACTAQLTEEDDAFNITLSGTETATLIGYRGDVLDSLQYLTLLISNKNNPMNKRLVIDGENYRDKRAITLSKLAKRLAFKASKNNEQIKLEPMNPFERRIIHSALHDDKYVTTESEGEEPNRYVVIKPVKRERPQRERTDRRPRTDRPRNNDYASKSTPVESASDANSDQPTRSYNIKRDGLKFRSFGGPKRKY